jgi:hypothetical protein
MPVTERAYQFEPKRHIDIHPENMMLNMNPALVNLEAPFLVGGRLIS